VLDQVLPYLPGEPLAAFDDVYVGTLPLPTGTLDPAALSRYLDASEQVARQFVARYPHVRFGWYLSPEAFLPDLANDQSADSDLTLQLGLIRRLQAVGGDGGFLWSPATGQKLSGMSVAAPAALLHQLTGFFAALSSATDGGYRLAVQDTLSRPCLTADSTAGPDDEAAWIDLLRQADPRMPVSINADLFPQGGCPEAGSPAQVLSRLYAYEQLGVPLGPCFEIRYWYRLIQR
jgi:hypothetical protein